MTTSPRLPHRIDPNGLLVGYSLEEEAHKPVMGFRFGEAGLVVPFKYFNMVFAVGLGFILWGDLPDAWTWAGSAVLISSGLYILHRERMRGAVPTPPPDPHGMGPSGRA